MDLNKLSPTALKAAMASGTAGWGRIGGLGHHALYMEPIPRKYWKRRRNCPCGCRKRGTHNGKANGVALTSGCELYVRRWVRNPLANIARQTNDR